MIIGRRFRAEARLLRLILRRVLQIVLADGIVRHAQHRAMQQAIAGEIEGADLDLGHLPRLDKPDIAVRHHRLDLEMAVIGDNDQERLCGGHDAADRMHR